MSSLKRKWRREDADLPDPGGARNLQVSVVEERKREEDRQTGRSRGACVRTSLSCVFFPPFFFLFRFRSLWQGNSSMFVPCDVTTAPSPERSKKEQEKQKQKQKPLENAIKPELRLYKSYRSVCISQRLTWPRCLPMKMKWLIQYFSSLR